MFTRQLLIAALAFTATQAVSVEKVAENNMALAQFTIMEQYSPEYYRGVAAGSDAFSRRDAANEEYAIGFVDAVLNTLPKDNFAVWNSDFSLSDTQSLLSPDYFAVWNLDEDHH